MRNKKLIAIFSVITVLTLLILLNSVIFSVQYINAHCYNADGSDIEQKILDSSTIKKGRSIFLLNENQVIKEVESSVPEVKVVNIERKFPNKVYINYVRIYEYLMLKDGSSYHCISNTGEVLRTVSQEEAASLNLIELKLKGDILGVDENNKIVCQNPNDLVMLNIVLSAFERLVYRSELIQLFETLDFTKSFVYLKTRTGVYFELQSVENAFEKLRLALSAYIEFGADSSKWRSGTLIISGGEVVKVSYSERDRYNDGIA